MSNDKNSNPPKLTNPILFECNKSCHINWECPLLKDKNKVIDKKKKKDKKRSQYTFQLSFILDSLGEEVGEEIMNLCLMAKGDSDSNKDQVSAPYMMIFYTFMINYKLHINILKIFILEEKIDKLEKTYIMTLIDLKKFKKSLDEMKIKKTRIKCEFS